MKKIFYIKNEYFIKHFYIIILKFKLRIHLNMSLSLFMRLHASSKLAYIKGWRVDEKRYYISLNIYELKI